MKKTDELKILNDLAKKNGGKLISSEWFGRSFKYEFEFKDSRRFFITHAKLKQNGWPQNADIYLTQVKEQSKTPEEKIEELREIAKHNKGKLISSIWEGTYHLYDFIFEDGTHFQRSATKLKSRGWPISIESFLKQKEQYSKTDKDLLSELEKIANNNKGKLITSEWKGSKELYEFEFEDGRKFFMSQEVIKQKWPKNSDIYFFLSNHKSRTDEERINELKDIAKKYKGKLISNKWLGGDYKYEFEFEFEDGRTFFMQLKHLRNNSWPKDPDHYLKKPEDFLEEMKVIAVNKKGSC